MCVFLTKGICDEQFSVKALVSEKIIRLKLQRALGGIACPKPVNIKLKRFYKSKCYKIIQIIVVSSINLQS